MEDRERLIKLLWGLVAVFLAVAVGASIALIRSRNNKQSSEERAVAFAKERCPELIAPDGAKAYGVSCATPASCYRYAGSLCPLGYLIIVASHDRTFLMIRCQENNRHDDRQADQKAAEH